MEIFQLVYLSFATSTFDKQADLDDILKLARERNSNVDVTGILLHKGGVFLQMLEGPEECVKRIYGSIATDLRHHSLSIIVKQYSVERLFPHWSMAHSEVSELDLQEIDSILPWKEIADKTQSGAFISKDKIFKILNIFNFKMSKKFPASKVK